MQIVTQYATKARPFRFSPNQPDLLFVSLDWSRPKDLRIPLAMASIEAYFRKNQTVKAKFQNFNLNTPDFDVHDILKVIDETRPRFLALGAYIWNEKYTPDVIRWTKVHHPETIIIMGGPPSYLRRSQLGERISRSGLFHQRRRRGAFHGVD